MATTISVSNLTASTALASGDSIPFLDVSDTTQSGGGSVDRITVANFFGGTSRVPVPFKQGLGTITTSTPALDSTVTWNAAVTFTHILVNITDTSSNAASKLIDLQVGGVSKFAVTKAGAVSFPSDLTINSGAFAVTASSGNTVVGGTLNVTGTVTNTGKTGTAFGSQAVNSGVATTLFSIATAGAYVVYGMKTDAVYDPTAYSFIYYIVRAGDGSWWIKEIGKGSLVTGLTNSGDNIQFTFSGGGSGTWAWTYFRHI